MGCDAGTHRRFHGQHRLRAGRGGRRAGEPDAVRSVLPGKASVLPRKRVDVSIRRAAANRPLLLAPHRPIGHRQLRRTDLHPGRGASERQGGSLRHRRPRHADRRNRRPGDGRARRAGQQLRRRAAAARGGPLDVRRDAGQSAGHRVSRRARQLQPRVRRRRQHPGVAKREAVRVRRAHRFARRDRFGPCRSRLLRLREQSLADRGRVRTRRRPLQSGSRLPAAPWIPASGVPRLLHAAAEAVAVDPPFLTAYEW